MAAKKRKKKASKKVVKKAVQMKRAKKKVSKVKAKPKTAAQRKDQKDLIGKVTHYFIHVNAAVVKLKKGLNLGEMIHIKGHTTDFTQTVSSMQLDRQPISVGKKGQEIGLEVMERVRTGDQVLRAAETSQ